ncbi:MAG: type I polyketide synthase, partial [Acidobacteriota bacterium]
MSSVDKFDYEIAVVGLCGRFPKANNIDEFWQNLRNGVEAISFFTDEELIANGVSTTALSDANYVKAQAILSDVELFDAAFFGFNPREAAIMDPQQRLFLEQAWQALEMAGYDSETCSARIGVYAGVSVSSYFLNNLHTNQELLESVGAIQNSIGNDKDYLATQVSYKLNLKGPSLTVQTACSTSLVAIHLACQSLLNRETDMALAGGVSIKLPQKQGYFYQEGGVLSSDGHCRAFDAQAQGTVNGSGVGVVVLKRLSDALNDGDYIHAIIKGSAINNDGSLKVGFTAPSVDGQAAVIEEALAMAAIDPETISYIETHGTATSLGDPIEIAALTQAFRQHTDKKGFCAIGSVKTNIGHLDAAAGVASFIKAVLSLKQHMLPPSLHFQQPNPQIDFANSPFYVNTTLREWPAGSTPRRAGISSFGIGGTNAHIIVEEPPIITRKKPAHPYHLLIVSAKTGTALETATTNLTTYLKEHRDIDLGDVAYTLQVGRRTFNHRLMLVASDLDDAVQVLETVKKVDASIPKRVLTSFQERRNRPVIFMFAGQGTQYVNMALELYQFESSFRAQIDHCAELLKPYLRLDLRQLLYPAPEQMAIAIEQLNQTFIAQPALFVVEYALAKLLIEWGISPQAMIGHSIGEYVAACLAGVFSLEDALFLVAARGELMQQLSSGTMLAVPLSEQELLTWLEREPTISLAAINGPTLCVVSGPTPAVERLEAQFIENGLPVRRLHTSHAFHSEMMSPILATFTEQVKNIKLNPPKIPYLSNLTGTWITDEEVMRPSYWAEHLRRTVRFSDGVSELLKDPQSVLLEIGPGQTLSTVVKQHRNSTQENTLNTIRHPHDHQSDTAFLLNTIGRLWLAGVTIDWSALPANQDCQRVPLPTYPFERQRYWIEANTADKKLDIKDWFYLPSWHRTRLPEASVEQDSTYEKACWLVFSDTGELGIRIATQLINDGHYVVTIKAGERFAKIDNGIYTINP